MSAGGTMLELAARAAVQGAPRLQAVVYGDAKTKGSTRSFVPRRRDGSIVTRDSGAPMVVTTNDAGETAAAWAGMVVGEVRKQMVAWGIMPVPAKAPVVVEFTFYRKRPASHMGTGRNANVLKASAPAFPAVKPDSDKLARCAMDALTGVLMHDDAQVVGMPVWKFYGTPRCEIRMWLLPATIGDPLVLDNSQEALSV